MKAILILEEMPEECCQCPCFIERYNGNEWHGACWCLEKEVAEYGRPSLCPLKPMPEKKEVCSLEDATDVEDWFDNGYNACIDELVGDEE